MIQIQDDQSLNQNTSAPVMPPAPGAPSTSASVPPVSSAPTSAPTNTAEIDRLLAELDKLSKELDAQKQPSAPVMAPSAPAPATPSMVSAPSPQASESPVKENTTEEKFDFDAFLADLEKKIDEQAKQSKTEPGAPITPPVIPQTNDSTDQFRQNRATAPLDVSAAPVVPKESVEQAKSSADDKEDAEDLKSQNIFDMLGLANITDEEKSQFLDELELMIWDDFVIHDLELLLTSEEYGKARAMLDDASKSEDERKEDLVVYLEKLIPDLDEVLYEKALELKSEMMAERLAKLKESADPKAIERVKQAEDMIRQNRWRSAAVALNTL